MFDRTASMVLERRVKRDAASVNKKKQRCGLKIEGTGGGKISSLVSGGDGQWCGGWEMDCGKQVRARVGVLRI